MARETTTSEWQNRAFRMGKGGTIAIIAVIVALLAGAGILAGVLAQRQAIDLDPAPVGGGGGIGDGGGGGGPAGGMSGLLALGGGLETLESLELPAGWNVRPQSPSPDGGGDGTGCTIEGNITLPATTHPEGQWQVAGQSETVCVLASGVGDWVVAGSLGVTDPATDAAAILAQIGPKVLNPETYTQLQQSEIVSQEPFGSVTSVATFVYQALYVDDQGSFPLAGEIWCLNRTDGRVFCVTAESSPPEIWQAHVTEYWGPVVAGGFSTYSGVSVQFG